MDNIVGGMFSGVSSSVDQALANLQKQRYAGNIAKTQGLGPYSGLAQIGLEQAQQMGDIVGRTLGVEDPAVAKARQRDNVWKEAMDQVQNKSDPEEVYKKLAETFQKYGMTQEAMQAMIRASDAKANKAKEARSERSLRIQEEGAKPKAKESTTYQKTDGTPAFVKDGKYYDADGNQLKQADLQLIPKDEFGRIMARGNTAGTAPGAQTQAQKAAAALAERRKKDAAAAKTAAGQGKDPYFDPMPGDSADTLALKAKRRKERDAQRAKDSSSMGGVGTEMVAP